MSEQQKITVVLGGVLDASFGAVMADAKDRVEALRRDSERAFNLQGFVGETRRLQQEYLQLHRIGDAGASATLRSLESNLALLRRQGLEVGNLTKLYERLGKSVRGSELRERGWQQLERAGRRAGELGTFAKTMAVPIGIAANYQDRIRGLAIRAGIAGTDRERQLSQGVEASARQSGMSRDDSASLLEALMGSGMRQSDAQNLLPLAAKFVRSQGADIGDTATLLRGLQVQAGLGTPGEIGKALDALSNLGKNGEFEAADLARQLPQMLEKVRPKQGEGLQAVARLGAMLELQVRQGATPEGAVAKVTDWLKVDPTTGSLASHARGKDATEQFQAFLTSTTQADATVDKVLALRNATIAARIDAASQASEEPLGSIGSAFTDDPLFGKALDKGTDLLHQAKGVVDEHPRVVEGLVGAFAAYKGGKALYGLGRGAFDLVRGGVLGWRNGKVGSLLPEIALRTGPSAGSLGGAMPAVLDAAGKDGARLARASRLLRHGTRPLGVGLALLGAAQTYASDGNAQQKGEGYGEAAGGVIGTALGAAVGSVLLTPGFGTAVGGALGGMLGERVGSWGGSLIGGWIDKHRDSAAAGVSQPTAPPTSPPVQNWNFAPQISVNVDGGLFEPHMLAEQLLPQLRRLLDDFSARQRNDSLWDLPLA